MPALLLRYLQGLNWLLLALGATFTVVLSVVVLMLYVNLDTAPQYRPQFEGTRISTLWFAAVMCSAALAVWGLRNRHVLGWPAQLLLLACVVGTVRYFLPD